jgi:hypothetical protein
MKKQNAYPRYLDAMLTKLVYPDTSKQYIEAIEYIKNVDNKVENGNSKISTDKK